MSSNPQSDTNLGNGTQVNPGAGTSRTLQAIKQIDPVEDFRRIPSMPCARESLLYGIGTGAGVGGIRFLSSRRVLLSCHWAVGTFVLVSSFSWYTCRSALSKEHRIMKTIAEKFPQRNIKNLKRKDLESPNGSNTESS